MSFSNRDVCMVTGGNGFVGSRMVDRLKELGCKKIHILGLFEI